jgi:hypothetical protein
VFTETLASQVVLKLDRAKEANVRRRIDVPVRLDAPGTASRLHFLNFGDMELTELKDFFVVENQFIFFPFSLFLLLAKSYFDGTG